MKKLLFAILFIVSTFTTVSVQAQCSVCRLGVQTNIDSKENDRGKGLNRGILYLMAVPYLMGGVAGVILWKNKKKG